VGGESNMNVRTGCYPIGGEQVTEENGDPKTFLRSCGHEGR
jgi:hypothetical protein